MTWRQLLTWQAWLDRQWNEPNRTDHYLMQIALEIKRVLHREPQNVQMNIFKIPFVMKKSVTQNKEEIAARNLAMAKAKWLGSMGISQKKREDRGW